MSHTASKHRVDPAEAIAVFSHNLFNEITCIAGLVHLLDATPPLGADESDFRGYLSELAMRSERLVERLQHGLLGLAPQPPEAAHDEAPRPCAMSRPRPLEPRGGRVAGNAGSADGVG